MRQLFDFLGENDLTLKHRVNRTFKVLLHQGNLVDICLHFLVQFNLLRVKAVQHTLRCVDLNLSDPLLFLFLYVLDDVQIGDCFPLSEQRHRFQVKLSIF